MVNEHVVPQITDEQADRLELENSTIQVFLPVTKIYNRNDLDIEELEAPRITPQASTMRVRIESDGRLNGYVGQSGERRFRTFNLATLHRTIVAFIQLLGADDHVFCENDRDRQRIRHTAVDMERTRANERAPETTFELSEMIHENIMKIVGWIGNTEQIKDVTHIVFEDAPLGSLDQYLQPRNGIELTDRQIFSFGYQLALALEHCHVKLRMMHRDLNPTNIYVFDGPTGKFVKLGGFVFARKNTQEVVTGGRNSWVSFAAPETLVQNAFNLIHYGFSADIWSFGMVLYYMRHKQKPFTPTDTNNKMNFCTKLLEGIRPEFVPGVEPNLKRIIEACWRTEKRDSKGNVDTIEALRPTAAQVKDFINYLRDQNIPNDALID